MRSFPCFKAEDWFRNTQTKEVVLVAAFNISINSLSWSSLQSRQKMQVWTTERKDSCQNSSVKIARHRKSQLSNLLNRNQSLQSQSQQVLSQWKASRKQWWLLAITRRTAITNLDQQHYCLSLTTIILNLSNTKTSRNIIEIITITAPKTTRSMMSNISLITIVIIIISLVNTILFSSQISRIPLAKQKKSSRINTRMMMIVKSRCNSTWQLSKSKSRLRSAR